MNSALSIGLWIAQIGLAVAFLVHGWAMLTLPEHLQDRMAYMLDIPPRFRRFIGVAELLAGVGLILPRLTGILPWLTPLAAMGLVIVMLGAIVFHLRRREYPNIVLNVLLLLIARNCGLWAVAPLGPVGDVTTVRFETRDGGVFHLTGLSRGAIMTLPCPLRRASWKAASV